MRISSKLVLVNDDRNLVIMDSETLEVMDTIELDLEYNQGICIGINNDKIWYFDKVYSHSNLGGQLVQIDFNGTVLNTIDFTYNCFAEIIFINNQMHLLDDRGFFHVYDVATEKITKTYNFYDDTEDWFDEGGLSIINSELIFENGLESNKVNISVFN